MNRTLTIEHNGQTLYGHIAKIKSTALGVEDHGIVTAYLHCQWDGSGIGVGGYCLDQPVKDAQGKFLRREGTGYGLDHIMQMVRTVGVEKWEDLKGADVIVLFDSKRSLGQTARGIAGLHNGKIFLLREHADEWKDSHPESDEVSA